MVELSFLFADELCTAQVFTTEFVDGISMEQCMQMDQETRNHVAETILFLCLKELFEFRYMQTDPNWANFMYNPATRQVTPSPIFYISIVFDEMFPCRLFY